MSQIRQLNAYSLDEQPKLIAGFGCAKQYDNTAWILGLDLCT